MGGRAESITVLHVDDEPDLLDLAAEFLERESDRIEVLTATDADEGLDRLARNGIDCVVSDYDMPGRNGIEFLEAVRERDETIPFILFTGKGGEEVASEAISAGVTDYLQKGTGGDQYAILANRIEHTVETARAKAEAESARDRLDTLSKAFPDVAFLIDADGTYLDVLTGSPEDLLAGEPEELVGSTFHDVLPASTADEFLDHVQRALETDEIQTLEYELDVIGGNRWFEARIAPLSSNGDDSVVWVARDITDRRAQRETLEQYRQIVDSMAEHACIWDTDGTIQVGNAALAEFMGTSIDDLPGRVSTLIPLLREELPGDPFQELVDGERDELRGQLEGEFPGHGQATVDYRLTPVEVDGEVTAVVGVGRHITEQYEYRRLLEAQRDRLEEFAGVLSHDMRNALNVAESRLELASDECDSPHLSAVSDAHHDMEGHLDDLLRLARGAGFAVDVEPVDPARIARSAWRSISTAAASLRVDLDGEVRADEDSLERLLEHLFRNAVEHGGPDVTVTVGRLDGGFYVADDGVGVPPEEREQVLEPGFSGGESGSGFGLQIVTEVAQAHGWTVALAESEGGGLRVEFDEVGIDA